MKRVFSFIAILIAVSVFSLVANAQSDGKFEKSFSKVDRVRIQTVLGSCKIEKSSDDMIHVLVEYTYDPRDYEIDYYEGNNSLDLEEEFEENNPRGYSKWSVAIPDGIDLRVESATGNIKIDGLKVELDGNSGTGNLTITKCDGMFELNSGTGNVNVESSKGEFKLNSGTGNVKVKSTSGEFDLNSGTGDVIAENIVIEKMSKLNSGTGDVYLELDENPKDDISINSGTGDSELRASGFDLVGYFEFRCNHDDGRIKCPVDFDSEDVEWRHGNRVEIKSFTKGSGSPKIKISTGTGTAELTM